MTVLLEYIMMTALLEYLDLFFKFKSGPANAGPAGPWAPALNFNCLLLPGFQ